jgi:uncharacterized membrane protein
LEETARPQDNVLCVIGDIMCYRRYAALEETARPQDNVLCIMYYRRCIIGDMPHWKRPQDRRTMYYVLCVIGDVLH